MIQDAEKDAAALDAVPEKERGPLHGIPVSIKVKDLNNFHTAYTVFLKECYDVGGTYSTAGCAYLSRTQVVVIAIYPHHVFHKTKNYREQIVPKGER